MFTIFMVGLIIDPKLNVDKVPRLILIGQQGEKYFTIVRSGRSGMSSC